ncbi:MAG: GNAT family N-acetyltransferase [Candidatus Nanohaloarchaea archaeon]|nr:GNAT family N-acetyltransferase [Candidatus Nanohaloarchaea archaeon]
MIADDYPIAVLEERGGPDRPQEALDPPWIWRMDDGEAVKEDIVDAYRTVWTQEPWNEVFDEQAAREQVEKALEIEGAVALYATPEDRDTSVLDATDYPDDPAYITADRDPTDEERFFDELEEPTAVGFTWAYDAEEAQDLMPDDEGFQDLLDNDAAYIAELGVVPGYQSQGIGSRLSEELLGELEEEYDQAVLRTNPDSVKAINLYNQLGFERTGYTDDEFSDRVYLVKELDGNGP